MHIGILAVFRHDKNHQKFCAALYTKQNNIANNKCLQNSSGWLLKSVAFFIRFYSETMLLVLSKLLILIAPHQMQIFGLTT